MICLCIFLQDDVAERALRACKPVLAFNMVLSELGMLIEMIHAADATRTRLSQLSDPSQSEERQVSEASAESPSHPSRTEPELGEEPELGTSFASPHRLGVGMVSRSAGLISSGTLLLAASFQVPVIQCPCNVSQPSPSALQHGSVALPRVCLPFRLTTSLCLRNVAGALATCYLGHLQRPESLHWCPPSTNGNGSWNTVKAGGHWAWRWLSWIDPVIPWLS